MTEQTPETPAVADRPDYIPEKFWDAETGTPRLEALATSYAHLETKLGGGTPAEAEAPTAAPEAAEGTPSPLEVKKPEVTDGGFALTKDNVFSDEAQDFYATEYLKLGKLSDATYATLQEAGVSRQLADRQIAAVAAQGNDQAAKHETYVFDAVGGQENYTAIAEWAVDNLSGPELDAYNTLVADIKNPVAAAEAAKGIQARYQAATSQHPKTQVRPNSLSAVDTASSEVFRNMQEVSLAMRDPRYARDPVYRDYVIAKLAKSAL